MAVPTLLLDTNVLLACVRSGKLGKYITTEYNLKGAAFDSLICVVTVGEMLALARKFKWQAEKTATMQSLLDKLVIVDIHADAVLKAYAEIDCFSEAAGKPMGKNDVWIAAVAKVTGAMLLTTDKDFDHLHPGLIQRTWIDEARGKAQ